MRAIEPENVLVWLSDLPKNNDAEVAEIDAVLARAAGATHFDSHFVERAARYAALLAPIEPSTTLLESVPTEFMAAATANGVGSMLAFSFAMDDAMPPMGPLMTACRSIANDSGTARHAACRTIAGMLAENSDSLLGAVVGARLRLVLAAPGPERDAAKTAERKLAWLREAVNDMRTSSEGDPFFTTDTPVRWRKPGANELSMLRDLLRDHGIPLDPPADWMPSSGDWQAIPQAQLTD